MATLAEKIKADNAKREKAKQESKGLLGGLLNAGRVVNAGLLNPNEYNAPAANRFKDLAFGLLGVVPGVGDYVSGAEAVDLFNRGENFAGSLAALGALPFVPALGGMVARHGNELDQAVKMDAVNMEPGWFRGGGVPDTKKTGPMYTQSMEEAGSYAAAYGKRTGKPSDVREYALPKGPFLNADKSYPPRLAADVAAILDDPYYGKEGAYLARQLRTYGPDERIAGGDLWQALESRYGNDGAAEVLDKLGHFKGAKGFTAPGEVYVFKSAPVRDVNAKFDPNRLHVDDIYGHATVPAMLATGLLGAGGLYGLNQIQGNNRQAASERKQ